MVTEIARDDPRAPVARPYVIVSADSHVAPSLRGQLREYCDRRHLDDFDRYADERAGFTDLMLEEVYPNFPPDLAARCLAAGQVEGLHDPRARLRDMDADGVAAD